MNSEGECECCGQVIGTDARILKDIKDHPDTYLTHIIKRTGISTGKVAYHLERLEQKGKITRTHDTINRHYRHINIVGITKL